MDTDNSINLMTHRSDVDVWAQRDWKSRAIDHWLAPWLVFAAGAGALAYGTYGASRGSRPGLWWIVGGAGLMGCAAAANAASTARWTTDVEQASADVVTQESLDSFPASDPPSTNATTTTPGPM